MAKVAWFKDYIQSLEDETRVDNIKTINRNKVLVEKEQLEEFLNDHKKGDNLFLIGILPDFAGKGDTAEVFKLTNVTQIMVLKKTHYSENDHDEFIDIYEETYKTLEVIIKKILEDSLSCTELRFLNPQSIKIEPVFKFAGCNGWKLMFNFDMFV